MARQVNVPNKTTYDVDTTVINPVDRIRWGPILAGLFTAISTLTILTLLGLGVGLGSFSPGDDLSNFGLGAGIWGAISALIAFGLGGWLAARTAAVPTKADGLLNGAMVWLVTIPLLLNLIGGGIGRVLGVAGGAATTAIEAAAPIAGEAAGAAATDPAAQATAEAAGAAISDTVDTAQATAQALVDDVSAQDVDNAADRAGQAALGALVPLLLGLAASAGGGYLGARERAVVDETTTVRNNRT